jgi:hypothetical protein
VGCAFGPGTGPYRSGIGFEWYATGWRPSHPHAGIAIRFSEAPTVTNARGRLRLDLLECQVLFADEDEDRYRLVGACVDSLQSAGNPADLLAWNDVRLFDPPGVVERIDFVHDAGVE